MLSERWTFASASNAMIRRAILNIWAKIFPEALQAGLLLTPKRRVSHGGSY